MTVFNLTVVRVALVNYWLNLDPPILNVTKTRIVLSSRVNGAPSVLDLTKNRVALKNYWHNSAQPVFNLMKSRVPFLWKGRMKYLWLCNLLILISLFITLISLIMNHKMKKVDSFEWKIGVFIIRCLDIKYLKYVITSNG